MPVITHTEGRKQVWIKNSDGSIASKEITTGTNDGINIEVLSGIAAGDTVVTRMEEAANESAPGGGAGGSSPFMPKMPSRGNKKSGAQEK